MTVISRLAKWFQKKPLGMLRFEDGIVQDLRVTKQGFSRFTLARPHQDLDQLKLPTLSLAEFREGRRCKCYVGVVESKAAITTFESRLTVTALQELVLESFGALAAKLTDQRFKTALRKGLARDDFAVTLGPALSAAVIASLAKEHRNRHAIEFAASNLPELRSVSTIHWGQLDAIKTAIAAFGLSKSAVADLVEVTDGADSTVKYLNARALEDNVIARDATVIDGYSLIEKHVTGLAVFENGDERLNVYTANKGPLEKMLGVDLIYVNETVGNIVMVQYKMLEPARGGGSTVTDWIFRPDPQFEKEVARMKLPPVRGRIADYRLHRSPFFFKLVKRKGDGESHVSFVVTLDHIERIVSSSKGKGPRSGIRVSYQALDGAYLRESDLIGLIRSGYIGTHRVESAALRPIISEVARGNRALVLAWQRRISRGPRSLVL